MTKKIRMIYRKQATAQTKKYGGNVEMDTNGKQGQIAVQGKIEACVLFVMAGKKKALL